MQSTLAYSPRRPLEYDAFRRRLWIFGQRCHHGATGSFVTIVAGVAVVAEREASPSMFVLGATGALLMLHDWKDKSIWFERGRGSQP